MLKISSDLSAYSLAAGEPFIMEVQLLAPNGGATDINDHSLVLSFYDGRTRELVERIEGERLADDTGEFFRWARPGSFSEELRDMTGLQVELARRYADSSRQVLGQGTLTIARSSPTLASLDGVGIGDLAVRVTLKASATLGAAPTITVEYRAYTVAAPSPPSFTADPTITHDGSPTAGETLTGVNGTVLGGTIATRQWLLNGSAISGESGATLVAAVAGDYQFRNIATGPGGSTPATSAAVTVAPAPTPAPSAAIIIGVIAGQSNAEGRAVRTGGDATTYARVEQYNCDPATAGFQTLQSVIGPLRGPYATTDSAAESVPPYYGPGEQLGMQLADDNPTANVILVPTARGGQRLVGGAWESNATPGAGGALFENMIVRANEAVAAAKAKYPGRPVTVRFFWVQGEFDANADVSTTTYQAALTSLIGRARARVTDAASAMFVIGSMVPNAWDFDAANFEGGKAIINLAHVLTSIAVSNVRYVKGPQAEETLHYNPVAVVRAQGRGLGAIVSSSAVPANDAPATASITVGSKLAIPLPTTASGTTDHKTWEIVPGLDAALFELSNPYVNLATRSYPVVRWTGDGTGPAIGSYSLKLRSRGGNGEYSATKTIAVTVAAAGAVSPAALFGSGERGMVWDVSDLSTLFQDREGTTPVTAAGQPVGRVNDKSPNANHWRAAANDATRPTYQVDSDSKPYLAFTGTKLLIASAPFTGSTAEPNVTATLGVLGAAQTSYAFISDNSAGGDPFVLVFASSAGGAAQCYHRNDAGVIGPTLDIAGMLDGATKRIITSQIRAEYAGGGTILPVRRIRNAPARGSSGTSGYSTDAQYNPPPITCNQAKLGGFNGRFYSGYAIGRILTDAEIKSAEDWVAARTITEVLP